MNMKNTSLLLMALLIFAASAWSQKITTKVVDNKGTIKWVIDSTTAVLTKGDSSILYVSPKQLSDSLAPYLNNADNGLTKDGHTVSLGGTLTHTTTIATSAANFLKITGLQSGTATTDSMVVIDPSGQLRLISPSHLLTALTAKNGLTKTGDIIELGGALIKPTVITAGSVNTLAIEGLQPGSTGADSLVLVNPTTGVLTRASAATLLQSGDRNFTATAGTTSYAVAGLPGDVTRVWVFRNGVKLLATTDYTVSGTNVSFTEAGYTLVTGDVIEVQWVK